MFSKKIKIIAVFKSSPTWIAKYVYILKKSFEKHLTIPHEFICLSDCQLDCKTIPLGNLHGVNSGDHIPEFWYKPQIFKPENKLNENCLYCDLDTIIRGNLDHLVCQIKDHNFLMSADPWKDNVSSSCLMWWNGDYSYLWDKFKTKGVSEWSSIYSKKDLSKYGDQGFISDNVKHDRIQNVIENKFNITRIRKKESGSDAKILFCSGRRKPWDQLEHPEVAKHWKNVL